MLLSMERLPAQEKLNKNNFVTRWLRDAVRFYLTTSKETSFTFFRSLFFMREQKKDASAPILLVGMAAFRYLAHVIFLREQSLL